MTFYDVFELLCKNEGITPTQAGRDNGIAQGVVSMWKKRGSTPNAATVSKIADYFGISIDYLVDSEAMQSFVEGLKRGEELRQIVLDNEDMRIGPYWSRAKAAMEKLNAAGQAVAAERIEELTEIPKYQKAEDPSDIE